MTHTPPPQPLAKAPLHPIEPPVDGLIRLSTVLKVIPVSKSVWWRGVKSGKYPKPVKISDNCTAWRVADIRALIDSF